MTNPLISFPVVAYNQERFIADAVKGAFSQTYSPLEIILSDDCSADRTFEIMKEMARTYQGPHTVRLNRNEKNLGIGGHVNKLMELTRGELVVPSAGDDISFPERVNKVYSAWEKSGRRAMSIFSNIILIDEDGKRLGLGFPQRAQPDCSLTAIVRRASTVVFGCSQAWHPEVFKKFGPFVIPLAAEDPVISFRSALIGQVQYVDEPLVLYRRHGGNVCGALESKEKLRDFEGFISRLRSSTTALSGIFTNWIKDVHTLETDPSFSGRSLKEVSQMIQRQLAILEKEKALLNAGYVTRLSILAKLLLMGAPIRRVSFLSLVFGLPILYRQYLKCKTLLQQKYNA